MTLSATLEEAGSAACWRAVGVRHAVLLRVLPALRHDVATPISVLRMTASLLQRKLAQVPADAPYCLQRIAALDAQIGSLTQSLNWLLDWDAGADAAAVTRSELVTGCAQLLRPLWAIEGVLLETGPAFDPQASARTGEPAWPRRPALRDLLLASLCFLYDTGVNLARIVITPDRHDALQLQRHAQHDTVDGAATPAPHRSEPRRDAPPRIDAVALAGLAAELGFLVRFSHDGVWMQLADRSSGAGSDDRPATVLKPAATPRSARGAGAR